MRKGESYVGAEYSNDEEDGIKLECQNLNENFLKSFYNIALKHGYENLLAPFVDLKENKNEDFVFLEKNIDGMSIVYEIENKNIEEKTIPTTWKLSKDPLDDIVKLKCSQICSYYCSTSWNGGHTNNHSGSHSWSWKN